MVCSKLRKYVSTANTGGSKYLKGCEEQLDHWRYTIKLKMYTFAFHKIQRLSEAKASGGNVLRSTSTNEVSNKIYLDVLSRQSLERLRLGAAPKEV